ncbi:MAG TPA: XRE family transcriptional regulator [Desulfomonilaceae bacterium]|nr:XRE family transcriptional regulator [Desulfomonilaceae bacterium]
MKKYSSPHLISAARITDPVKNGMRAFGKYVKDRMERLQKSQKSLAEQLKVSPAYISQIITGKKNPPDLGKLRNRGQLRIWCEFLDVTEDEILGIVRYELHRVPPRPSPRFPNMRDLLLERFGSRDGNLVEEIRSLELHPAENVALLALVQIYLVLQEDPLSGSAYGPARFKDFCHRARGNKEFVEGDLVRFFRDLAFSWVWDIEMNDVRFSSESAHMCEAIDKIREILGAGRGLAYHRTIPVIAHVSAGEGFEYTDGGFPAGEGFEHVDLPPGVDPALAQTLYCVRVRGDSLREFFGDGTLLFIKPESWEEIRDGDLVIFKDSADRRAFVKKVEFSGESLILKSMNPMYRNMVLRKPELMLLERVMAIVL